MAAQLKRASRPRHTRNSTTRAATATVDQLERRLLFFATSPTFSAPTYWPAGTLVSAIASGDFNKDGKIDVVTANTTSERGHVLLGNGTGGFAAPKPIAISTDGTATAAAVGDFNHDGNPDIALATDTGVLIAKGDGLGNFAAPVATAITSPSADLIAADLNGDGDLDLIAAKPSPPGTVVVMLGNGAIDGFTHATSFEVAAGPTALASGDLNADGNVDVVVANSSSNSFNVLLGDGTGNFAVQPASVTLKGPRDVVVADRNGDGKLDLVFASRESGTVDFYDGVGDGTFTLFAKAPAGTNPTYIATADFNADGRADFAIASENPNTLSMVYGFDATLALSGISAISGVTRGLVAADFNRDGRPDLAAGGLNSGSVAVVLNTTPSPASDFAPTTNWAAGNQPEFVAAGDLNNDGHQDLIVADTGVNSVSALLGNGSGGFAAPIGAAVGSAPFAVALADLNGDGKLDAVAACYNDDVVSILIGDGTGHFAPAASYAVGNGPDGVVIGDFNLDGRPDIVTADFNGGTISVLLNNGAGFATNKQFAAGAGANQILMADLNADGKLDLATADINANTLSIFLGDGTGNFAARRVIPTSNRPYEVAAGDLNGDGKLDLVVANGKTASPGLDVFYASSNSTTGYAAGAPIPTGAFTRGVVIADVNGDGQLDVIGSQDSGDVAVALGDGGGRFARIATYAVHQTPTHVAVADFDQDGRPDLAVANSGSDDVSVLLNKARSTPPPVPTITIDDVTKNEGDLGPRSFTFTVSLSAPATSLATVNYATADGTALVSDSDYTPISNLLTFNVGEQTKLVTVSVIGDKKVEPNETFYFRLSGAIGATIARTQGVGTINDDDAVVQQPPPVTVYLSDINTSAAPINGFGPYERDKSNGESAAGDGKTIKLNGATYTKGLGVHAQSDLRYAIPSAGSTTFMADVGVDDEVGSSGNVIFQLFKDATKIFDSGVMTGSSATQHIEKDITGGGTLRLVVLTNGSADSDHADWAGARMVTTSTVTAPPPPSTYLSDLAPIGNVTNGWGTYERDQSNGETKTGDGRTLTINGATFSKGLGVHANSAITYNVPAGATHLLSSIGIDDEVGSKGNVIFRVFNAATNAPLFSSSAITGTMGAQAIDVLLSGVTQVRIVVDSNGSNDSDHADWGNARFA